jgi:hypothetical protein
MLPEDEEELFTDGQGSTWNRIVVFDRHGNEICRLRALTPEFQSQLEEEFISIGIRYFGGNMDGVTV